jgi:hypothetical protein
MVRSQEIRGNSAVVRQSEVRARPVVVTPQIRLQAPAYLITALLVLVALYAVLGNVMGWAKSKVDDMRYGATRTYHVTAVVGHEDSAATPTHLTALNLNRQVLVIEFPGGDPAKMRTITGPYLFGADEDKTPVLLRLEDVNRDNTPDLIVNIKNEEIIYTNRDGQFQPITADERANLAVAP